MDAYAQALAGNKIKAASSASSGTLSWLVGEYMRSPAWKQLSQATRKQRGLILKHVLTSGAEVAFSEIDKQTIIQGRDRRADRPAAARHFIMTLRSMFTWAVEHGWAEADPTQGVKVPKQKTDGHHTWTDDECARYEMHWQLGTRERLAYDLLLYTDLRRSDAVRAGRQHVKNGVLTLPTVKTGEVIWATILLPLEKSLAAGPTGDLAFIVGKRRQPMTKESFGNWFREVCVATGLPHCSAHGLRKAGAVRAAEAGATESELEAMFGWRGGKMASHYTRMANRKKLSQNGFANLRSHLSAGGNIPAKK